jgi:hypothetical protein
MKMSIASYRRKHGIRLRSGDVAITDKRSPLLRLLQDARTIGDHIEVNYARQWPTFFRAQRLGYIDAHGDLTDKGKELLACNSI